MLLMIVVMLALMTVMIEARHLSEESMGQEMKESIASESTNCQSDEKLDEMLVEHLLHDGNHKNSEDSAQRDDNY